MAKKYETPVIEPVTDPADAIPEDGTDTSVGTTDPAPEPEGALEQPQEEQPQVFPYEATVGTLLAIVRKGPTPGKTTEGMRQVGTLRLGTKVTVVAEENGFSQIKNGLWVRTAYLSR